MLCVRTEAVTRRSMAHTVRAFGAVSADEHRRHQSEIRGVDRKSYSSTRPASPSGAARPCSSSYSPDLVLA
jgi:hypothetical protein